MRDELCSQWSDTITRAASQSRGELVALSEGDLPESGYSHRQAFEVTSWLNRSPRGRRQSLVPLPLGRIGVCVKSSMVNLGARNRRCNFRTCLCGVDPAQLKDQPILGVIFYAFVV